MTYDTHSSIFLITSEDPENTQFGTGFVIYKDGTATYLITCLHVVIDVGGADKIKVGSHKAEVIASGFESDVNDLAILRVDDILDVPVNRLQDAGTVNTPFVAAGFQLFDRNFLIRPIKGRLGEKVGIESRAQLGRIDAWDLKIDDEYDLQRGYSGSPVFDENTGSVLAVVSHRIAEGRKGIAISIKTIKAIWKDIPPLLIVNPSDKSQVVSSLKLPTVFQNKTPIFVGREKQIQFLSHKLDNVLGGNGATGFIIGEAGSGKSTLAIEFARQVLSQNSELILCIGHINMVSGFGNSYAPFKSILEQILLSDNSALDGDGEEIYPIDVCANTLIDFGIRDLGPFSSFAGAATNALHEKLKGYKERGAVDVNTLISFDQNVLLDWYSKIIRNLSKHFPLLLIVEDLQWADDSSLQMLLNLGRVIEFSPIMIIGTLRPEEATNNKLLLDIRNHLGKIGTFTIDLRTETDETNYQSNESYLFCKEYLLKKYGTIFSKKLLDLLVRLTAGNALFVSEILINLEEQSYIVFFDGKWTLQSSIDKLEKLPSKIEHIMSQRIDRLEEILSKSIKYASVEGEVFTAEVISRIQNIDDNTFLHMTIDQLVRIHQIIREMDTKYLSSGTRLHLFSFNHILTQRYIYEYLLSGIERELFHETVANELEKLWGDSALDIAAQLTTHYSLAKIPDKTVKYALVAANVFVEQFGWSEVAQFARLGIRMWEENPNLSELFDISIIVKLRLLYAKSEFEGGIYGETIDHIQAGINTLQECLPFLEQLESTLAADVYLTLGKLVATQQVVAQYYGNEYLEKALKIYEQLGDKEGIVATLSIYAFDTNLANQAAADEQLKIRIRCLELVKELNNPVLLSKSLSDLAIHYFNFDTDAEEPLAIAEEYALQSLNISSKLNNPIAEMYSQLILSWVYHHRGYYGEKLENLRVNLLELARKHGQTVFEADALTDVGHYYSFRVETHNKANKIMKDAYEFRSRMGRHTVHDCENYAGYLFRIGQFGDCISMLENAAKQQDNDRATRTRGQIVRALALTGKTKDAQKLLKDLVDFINENPSAGVSANSPLMFSYMLLGDKDNVFKEAKKVQQAIPSAVKRGMFHTYYDLPTELAEVYRLLQNSKKAIYWIESAHQNWESLTDVTDYKKLVMFWEHEFVRGKVLFDRGMYQDSWQIMEKVNQIFNDINHYSESESLMIMGQILQQQENIQNARNLYTKAAKKAKTFPLPHIINQVERLLEVTS